MRPKGGKANTDQLRDDIDRGRTGEKVRSPDPAAAPLGTDDEAAGTPAERGTVAEVRRNERARGDRTRRDAARVQVQTWAILLCTAGLIALLLWIILR